MKFLNNFLRSQTFGEDNGKMKGGLVICGDLEWKLNQLAL
jgi:hypothetical protein